jgi:hypothetical protein
MAREHDGVAVGLPEPAMLIRIEFDLDRRTAEATNVITSFPCRRGNISPDEETREFLGRESVLA